MPRFSKLAALVSLIAALGWGPAGGCASASDAPASPDAAAPAPTATPTSAPTPKDAGVDASTRFSEKAMRYAADAFNAKYCEAFKRCDPTSFTATFGEMKTCMGAGGLVAISSGTVRYVNELAAPYEMPGFGSKGCRHDDEVGPR